MQYQFEQPIIFKQSPMWSRLITWGIVGTTTLAIIWSCIATIGKSVPSQGQLEPQEAVKEVQAPLGGVVKDIHVKDGQKVKANESLLNFDNTAAEAQFKSLQAVRKALAMENMFYSQQLLQKTTAPLPNNLPFKISPEILALTENRASLLAENQIYKSIINNSAKGMSLSLPQQARLRGIQAEFNSRVATTKLETAQIQRQLRETQIQVANAKNRFLIEFQILKDIKPLAESGAISRIQYSKQIVEVNTHQTTINQLTEEQERLRLNIAQSIEQTQNTIALSFTDIQNKIAENEKRIAEIDSQLSKSMIENFKKIAEVESQLSQVQQSLKYQDLKAPVSGTVFEMKAHNGYVANTSQPILKIVPDENLLAKVYITNQDIGFIKEGMKVDVRIDSFSFSEYGDIKGEIVWIGSDALPPDQFHPSYRFPAKIRLQKPFFRISGKEVELRPGMSVNANITVQEKRPIISLFTQSVVEKIETIKQLR